MPKIKFILTIVLFFTSKSWLIADTSNVYIGTITTSSQQIYSYKISFKVDKNGKLTGTSTTDIYGKNKTTSQIVGKIDEKNNRISFYETNNTTTKSFANENSFCFISIENIAIKKEKNKNIIMGEYIGKFKNNQECSKGNIYLINTKNIEDKLNNIIDKLNISEDSLQKLSEIVSEPKITGNIPTLKSNETKKINWSLDKIYLEVWDGSVEDNDAISIYFNNKLIANNLIITKEKTNFIIPFEEKSGILKIVATDEGTVQMNTVNFMFKHNTDKLQYVTILKLNEAAFYEFKKP